MRFAHPQLLWFLVTVAPLLAVFLWWSWRRRQRLMREFVPERLLAVLTVGFDAWVEKRRLMLIVLAAAALLFALARPQWGLVWEESVTQGRDILVAIDSSRSMLATDTPPADRLTRAKLAALDLSQIAATDRFGLIAFAGSSFLQCPLTLDEFAFAQSVNAIDTDIIPQGGTALAEAIETALKAFEKSGENHRVLVLITDGEDHDGGVDEAVRKAQKAGLRIFTVGVGTPEGEVIRVADNRGNLTFLRDDAGNVIRSRLNETLLRRMAAETGGFYLPLSGARPMETLFKRGIEQLPKTESEATLTRSYREQFHWPVLVAVLLLLMEMFWRKKTEGKPTAVKAAGLMSKTAALLVGVACVAAGTARASSSKALKDYETGNYGKSQAEYERLAERRTQDARLRFNAGSAAFKAGDFDKALLHFMSAAGAEDLRLQQQSYYNLGNTLFKMGDENPDLEDREVIWEDSVRNFENALKLNGQDEDALHNLAFVRQRLEKLTRQLDEMAEQQNQQPGGQGEGDQPQRSRRNRRDRQQQDQQGRNPGEEQSGGQRQRQGQSGEGGEREDERSQSGGGEREQQAQGGGQGQGEEEGQGRDEQSREQSAMAMGVMTPMQAQQMLDAIKTEERSIIFLPPQQTRGPVPEKPIKDW